jgi:hypothetical protein
VPMRIALYVIAGWITVGALGAVALIGKPRTPTTGGVATVIVAVDAAIVVALVLAAGKLAWLRPVAPISG